MFAGSFLFAQSAETRPGFSRLNSFGLFSEYSNNSSHMLMGQSRQRKLLDFGLSYSRRIWLRPTVDLQYFAEVRPLMFPSDPVVQATSTTMSTTGPTQTYQYTYRQSEPCRAGLLSSFMIKSPQGVTYTNTTTGTCGRQWAFGEALSPVGLKLNLHPQHRLQLVLTGVGGYMLSSQPIPVSQAGSFNFIFSIGAGLEWCLSAERSPSRFGNRSLRAEYRYQHISNHWTASENPGIDNGVLQVTYAFGR